MCAGYRICRNNWFVGWLLSSDIQLRKICPQNNCYGTRSWLNRFFKVLNQLLQFWATKTVKTAKPLHQGANGLGCVLMIGGPTIYYPIKKLFMELPTKQRGPFTKLTTLQTKWVSCENENAIERNRLRKHSVFCLRALRQPHLIFFFSFFFSLFMFL